MTLIELLIVLTIVGILVTISISSYTGHRQRASDSVAQTNIRAALPAVESYRTDNDGYASMTAAALQEINPGAQDVEVLSAGASSYCLRSTVEGRSWYRNGPVAPITLTACS